MNAQPETSQYDAADQYDSGDGPNLDEPTGPPYRAIAMVLLAAVVLAIGIGLVQLFGGDDSEPAANDDATSQTEGAADGQQGQQPAGQAGEQGQPGDPQGMPTLPGVADGQQPGAEQQPGAVASGAEGSPGGQQPAPAGGPAVTEVPVQIFNNSNVTGLAGRTGEALRETGFAVGDVANLPSNRGVVSESVAFYGNAPGEQQAAEAIAGQLGIVAKPRPADFAADAPGVLVIVTQDLER